MSRVLLPLILLALATAPFGHAAVPAVTDTVVLNEVLYNPAGTESGAEVVELYNPTATAINITGWSLTDGDRCLLDGSWTAVYRLQLNGTIPAFGHLAVTVPDVGAYFKCLSLANGGDTLTLLDADGAVVDEVTWPGDAPARVDDGTSIQRCHVLAPGAALATNATWTTGAPSLGTPNAPCV